MEYDGECFTMSEDYDCETCYDLDREIKQIELKYNSLKNKIKNLQEELLRVRTTETASAHALDIIRQELGISLKQNEHPANLLIRIRKVMMEGSKSSII